MSTVKESAPGSRRATAADLAKVEGKAELIDGRVVHLMATGYLPNRVAFRIARSLDEHADRAESPAQPTVFGAGQEVDAEPAVPGWRIAVDRVFS